MPYETTSRAPFAMALVEAGRVPDGVDGEQVREQVRLERSTLLRDGVARRLILRIAGETDLDPDEEWERYRVYRALSSAIWVRSDVELRGEQVDEAIFSDMFDSLGDEAP
jgi:hypothetical protein